MSIADLIVVVVIMYVIYCVYKFLFKTTESSNVEVPIGFLGTVFLVSIPVCFVLLSILMLFKELFQYLSTIVIF